jgi:hypothetical protein
MSVNNKNVAAAGSIVTGMSESPVGQPLKGTRARRTKRLRWLKRSVMSFEGDPMITYDRRAIGTTYLKLQVGAAGVLLIDDLADRIVGLSTVEYNVFQSLAYDQTIRHLIIGQLGGAAYRNHQSNKPVISITRTFLMVNTAVLSVKKTRTIMRQANLRTLRADVLYCLALFWLIVLNVYRNLLASDEHVLVSREHPKHEVSLDEVITGYLRNAVCHALGTNARVQASASGFMQVGAFSDDAGRIFRELFTAVDGVLEHRLAFEKYLALVRCVLKLERIPVELQGDQVLAWMLSDITFVTIALDDANATRLPFPMLRASMRLMRAHDALLALFKLPGIFVDRVPFSVYSRLHHIEGKNPALRHCGINAGIFLAKAYGTPVTTTPVFTTVQVDGLLKVTPKDDAGLAVSDMRTAVVNSFGIAKQVALWKDTPAKGPVIRVRGNLPKQALQNLGLGACTAFAILSNNRHLRGYAVQQDVMLQAIVNSKTRVIGYVGEHTPGLLSAETGDQQTDQVYSIKWWMCGLRDEGGNFICPNLWVALLLGGQLGAGNPLEAVEEAPAQLITRDTLIRPGNIVVTDIEAASKYQIEVASDTYARTVTRVNVEAPLALSLGVSIALGHLNRQQWILRRIDVYATLEQGLWLHALRMAAIPTESGGMDTFLQNKPGLEALGDSLLMPPFIELASELLRNLQEVSLLHSMPNEHEGTIMLAASAAATLGYLTDTEGQDPWLVYRGITRREFMSNLTLILKAAALVEKTGGA